MKQIADPAQRRANASLRTAATALACVLVLTVAVNPAPAQTYTILHDFTGGQDGSNPYAELALDRAGNLYGTAFYGGVQSCHTSSGTGCGTVFRLSDNGSGWVFSPLYDFTGQGNDGAYPAGKVVFGSDGSLYGTTYGGGYGGTVFNLKPSPTSCKAVLCGWSHNVLYAFTGGSDGGAPEGGVVFDKAGNLYGTTFSGGQKGGQVCGYGQNSTCGVVYELTRSGSAWTEDVLHTFTGGDDGANPANGLVLDGAGNLYGTTTSGGSGIYGTVFQLGPSGSGWTENVLYSFGLDGGEVPYGSLIFDASGNLYGATVYGSPSTVFELTPSNGAWNYSVPYGNSFGGVAVFIGTPTMDAKGNLYGTTYFGGSNNCEYGCGTVFKLTPSAGGWTYTLLHEFAYDDGQTHMPESRLARTAASTAPQVRVEHTSAEEQVAAWCGRSRRKTVGTARCQFSVPVGARRNPDEANSERRTANSD